MIIQRLFSEGRHTKEVRRKTDKWDSVMNTINGASAGAISGSIIGSILGKSMKGATIGAGIGGGAMLLSTIADSAIRKHQKETKYPTKPIEVSKEESSTGLGKALAVGGSGYFGYKFGKNYQLLNDAAKIDEKLKEIYEKIVKGTATEKEILAYKEAAAAAAEGKLAEVIANHPGIKTRFKTAGGLGAAGLATVGTGMLIYNKNKAKKLQEAYKKDKEEAKEAKRKSFTDTKGSKGSEE